MLELKHISYSVREADETLGILKDSFTFDGKGNDYTYRVAKR